MYNVVYSLVHYNNFTGNIHRVALTMSKKKLILERNSGTTYFMTRVHKLILTKLPTEEP